MALVLDAIRSFNFHPQRTDKRHRRGRAAERKGFGRLPSHLVEGGGKPFIECPRGALVEGGRKALIEGRVMRCRGPRCLLLGRAIRIDCRFQARHAHAWRPGLDR
jgi:hypothetical protein